MKSRILCMMAALAVVLSAATQRAALAQNNSLAILAGGAAANAAVELDSNPQFSASMAASVQLSYTRRVQELQSVSLFIELPLTVAAHDSLAAGRGFSAANQSAVYFTPGVRFLVPLHPRVALYGAAGGGAASYGDDQVSAGSGLSVRTGRHVGGVFDFGGGLDLRLTRFLGLRLEVRDYVGRAGSGGSAARHRGIFQGGIAFHF
jgi:hypothetical protein